MVSPMMNSRRILWLQALGWGGLIYLSLPLVRPVCNFLKTNLPFDLFVNMFLIGFLLAGEPADGGAVEGPKPLVNIRNAVATFVILVTTLGILSFIKIPEERIHFLEYGLLAILVQRAVRIDIKNRMSFGISFLLTAIWGIGDEAIQYLLPNRVFETKDILYNIAAGGMGIFIMWMNAGANRTIVIKKGGGSAVV